MCKKFTFNYVLVDTTAVDTYKTIFLRIVINKHDNHKFKFKKLFLLQSRIIPHSFLPTSGLFCKDATHILNTGNQNYGMPPLTFWLPNLTAN